MVRLTSLHTTARIPQSRDAPCVDDLARKVGRAVPGLPGGGWVRRLAGHRTAARIAQPLRTLYNCSGTKYAFVLRNSYEHPAPRPPAGRNGGMI